MREELINAGDSLTVNGRIYGLRFVAASPLSTWTPDGTTIARPVSALREVRPDHNPGWWSVVKLAAGAGGPLQVEIADSEDDEFGELAGVPLNLDANGFLKSAVGAGVKLASGIVTNANNVAVDVVPTIDLSPYRRVAMREFNTLDAGTAQPRILDAAPGQAIGVGSAFTGFAQGNGGATYLTVGEVVAGTSTSVADVYFQGRFFGPCKAQVVVAGGVTHINSVQWELWGFP